jgi:hypothetical protein
MNNETRTNIERIKKLNQMDDFTDKNLVEFHALCVAVLFPLLNEIDRLNKKIKTLEQAAKK